MLVVKNVLGSHKAENNFDFINAKWDAGCLSKCTPFILILIPIELDAVNNEYSEYGEKSPGHIKDGIKISKLVQSKHDA